MPSFFRSDTDVKIVYDRKRVLTPEEKKQKKRLMIPFDQSIRRAGTKGNFFFHRKNGTVGGPILILEPQGPVDRGIFQGGITKFGETLSGTFECPKPGFLILHVKKNVAAANKLKFSRAIRKAIKNATGMMTSGGEDRIQIITPKDKERVAKEAAAERKREAAEARARKDELAARRKLKREEARRKKAEKRAAAAKQKEQAAPAPEKTPAPRKPRRPAPRKEKRVRAEAPAPEPKPPVTPEQVEQRWEAADTSQEGWLESEAKAQDMEATSINVSARAEASRDKADEAFDNLQKSAKHLHDLHEGLKKAGGRAKFDLQREIAAEEAKQQQLQAEFERANEAAVALEEEAANQAEALEAAREDSLVKQIEAAQARLDAAEAEAQAGSEDDDPDAAEDSARELADAARQLQLAEATRAIAASLKLIEAGLKGIDHEAESEEFKSTRNYIVALMWESKELKKGITQLRAAAEKIEDLGDRIRIMATQWDHHPDISWAESAVDMIVEF